MPILAGPLPEGCACGCDDSRPAGTAPTVGGAMITAPVLHPATVTVAQARTALDDPHRHLLLIVSDGRLLGTLTREDLAAPTLRAAGPALEVARLVGRTTGADVGLAAAYDELVATGDRRRAVVDADGVLLGLLCLKASGTGFCSDAGVAARRQH